VGLQQRRELGVAVGVGFDAPGPDGERPDTVAFCKEFELR